MKTYKVKDQEEAVKNAKLFYETVKLAWDHHITYCYHDLIHMIKNDLCYDLYDNENGWGMKLGANDADVCSLAEIFKEKDDDEDDASEKEEERKNIDNDNETKATDEIVEKLLKIFYTFRLLPPVSI